MAHVEVQSLSAKHLTDSPEYWDRAVLQNGGHLLQSWNWGEFKRRHGWDIERIAVGDTSRTATCSILFKHSGPFSIAYVPRGPSVPSGDAELGSELLAEVDRVCLRRRALHVILEPDQILPLQNHRPDFSYIDGPPPIQPGRT